MSKKYCITLQDYRLHTFYINPLKANWINFLVNFSTGCSTVSITLAHIEFSFLLTRTVKNRYEGNNSLMVLHNMQVGLTEFITSRLKDIKMHIKKKNLVDHFIYLSPPKLHIESTQHSNVTRGKITPSHSPPHNQTNLNLSNVAIKTSRTRSHLLFLKNSRTSSETNL